MTPRLASLSEDDRRITRLQQRIAYLPHAITATKNKLRKLEGECVQLGLHDLAALCRSSKDGDLIATEWLKRLGVVE